MNNSLLDGIGSGQLKRIIVAKIKINVDLLEAIEEILKKEKIERGIILGGVGALQKAIFRNMFEFPKTYPIRPENRIYLEIKKPMELVSLNGYISPRDDGSTYIHSHFSASIVKGKTVVTMGGHLINGTVTHVRVAVTIAELENIPMNARVGKLLKSYEMHIDT